MFWIFIVSFSIYFIVVILFSVIWVTIPSYKLLQQPNSTLTVVIVFRNEAFHLPFLLADLEKQTLDRKSWDIIFVNDFSEDDSLFIINNFLKNHSIQAEIISNNILLEIASPKKRGISQAIKRAKGELIVCTDADCRLPSTWLQGIASFYEQTHAYFISSPVRFFPIISVFEKIQALEFSTLIGSGAACIGLHRPTMCNGANIAYKKSIFEELQGFTGSENVASGDDEFLMHKFAKAYPQKVKFNKSEEVVVSTSPHTNLKSFFEQRKRWASKWEHYKNWSPKLLAVFIFFINILAVFIYFSAFWNANNIIWLLIGLKFSVEFVFLILILYSLKQIRLLWWVPILFVLYPFYVLIFALISRKKNYIWKGRKHAV
ncbi:MAG: glycosyltransferase [Raineya sp.]|jgi:glycosyltransferase involved in cell wall biosynthesis|nr:glycosyltransferase [Raineya sp.]